MIDTGCRLVMDNSSLLFIYIQNAVILLKNLNNRQGTTYLLQKNTQWNYHLRTKIQRYNYTKFGRKLIVNFCLGNKDVTHCCYNRPNILHKPPLDCAALLAFSLNSPWNWLHVLEKKTSFDYTESIQIRQRCWRHFSLPSSGDWCWWQSSIERSWSTNTARNHSRMERQRLTSTRLSFPHNWSRYNLIEI